MRTNKESQTATEGGSVETWPVKKEWPAETRAHVEFRVRCARRAGLPLSAYLETLARLLNVVI